jgi:carbamoyl-phosphate synthase small subunit
LTGYLVLENGDTYAGEYRGSAQWESVGEVVFNTSLVGYQEVVTDPSYYQQIIVMTAPEQGNYGTLESERESKRVWAQGFICVNLNQVHRIRERRLFEDELFEFKSPVLADVDTRKLTLQLRSQGTPWGALVSTGSADEARAIGLERIKARKKSLDNDWVYHVSEKKTQVLKGQGKKGRVALLDYGVKTSIVDQLLQRVSEVAIFNSRAKEREILDWSPDGIFLTNGPGDPALVQDAPQIIRELLGQKPLFGICMGHQLLSLALGGKTYKLKFGHRGGNHPVKDLLTGEIYMTSQNHGYACFSVLERVYELSVL